MWPCLVAYHLREILRDFKWQLQASASATPKAMPTTLELQSRSARFLLTLRTLLWNQSHVSQSTLDLRSAEK
jgi:hypothetical protein